MTKLANRALMTTATTGTGTITLGSAVSGYQSFADAGVVDADVVRYVIEDGSDWEIGTGTYTASGTTLSRTVSESSNADAALNLTGSAVVFVGAAAEDIPAVQELYAENPSSPTAPSATGTNAVAIGSESVSVGTRSIALGDARASGTDSFAAAIANNTSSYGASNTGSIAIGRLSKSTNGGIAIGSNATSYPATATGANAICIGDGTASGANSFCLTPNAGGEALAQRSVVIGSAGRSNVFGKYVYTGIIFAAIGDCQSGSLVLCRATTNDTATVLTSNNSSPDATNQIILPNNSAYAFHGTIVAREQASAGTDCAAWKIEGLIRREGNAASTTLVASTATAIDNTPTWGLALSADTTNGGLKIEVTGAAATNIRWVATVHTSEVTY